MLKYYLINRLPDSKGCGKRKPLLYPAVTYDSPFTLNDSKSCTSCKQKPGYGNCNEIVLFIDVNKPLEVLNFEEFVCQMDHTSAAFSKRCDYLIYDNSLEHNRIAFCELTCSTIMNFYPNNGKYSNGKRARAHDQLFSSIESLLQVELLNQEILTFKDKVAIVGWRERDISIIDEVTASMIDFSVTPDSEEKMLIFEEKLQDHNFRFIVIKYPNHYQWED